MARTFEDHAKFAIGSLSTQIIQLQVQLEQTQEELIKIKAELDTLKGQKKKK